MAAFTLQWQGWVVTTEIIWPSKFENTYLLALYRKSIPVLLLGTVIIQSCPKPSSLLILHSVSDNKIYSYNFIVFTTLRPTAAGQTSPLTFRLPCPTLLGCIYLDVFLILNVSKHKLTILLGFYQILIFLFLSKCNHYSPVFYK